MEVAEIEFRRRKVRWVEVECVNCLHCIMNDDEFSEIFSLKCKISNVKMDLETAMKKRKIICDSYKASS
ncbi:MAG: hypothetical protein QXY18_00205 [Nitrososphaerota archaeon]